MPNLIAWLLAAVWPLAKKVLVSLGIGLITYGTLTLLAKQASDQIIAAWGAAPEAVIQIGSLMGVPQSIGIILGGIMARVSFVAVGKLGILSK